VKNKKKLKKSDEATSSSTISYLKDSRNLVFSVKIEKKRKKSEMQN
jgi:hypothetical protein